MLQTFFHLYFESRTTVLLEDPTSFGATQSDSESAVRIH